MYSDRKTIFNYHQKIIEKTRFRKIYKITTTYNNNANVIKILSVHSRRPYFDINFPPL